MPLNHPDILDEPNPDIDPLAEAVKRKPYTVVKWIDKSI